LRGIKGHLQFYVPLSNLTQNGEFDSPMTRKLMVFDLDGTLVDSRLDLCTGVNLMREDYSLGPLTLDTVCSYVGNGVRRLVERALSDAATAPDTDEAVARMKTHYLAHMLDETSVYPGVPAALARLHEEGLCLVVASNKPEGPSRRICEALGLGGYLDLVLGGDSCPNMKPHPEPLLAAARHTGTELTGAWMVGDNYTDLGAGRRAGFQRCFCRYGFGVAGDETFDLAVDSLGDFADAILEAPEGS
jgi:phosphoglycolate phosphatase